MTDDNGNHAATPGPWTVELDNHGNGGFSEWWNVGPGGSGVGKIWNETDARLIAAAPEMLRALEMTAQEFALTETANMPDWLEDVEAAIAKAKGD